MSVQKCPHCKALLYECMKCHELFCENCEKTHGVDSHKPVQACSSGGVSDQVIIDRVRGRFRGR